MPKSLKIELLKKVAGDDNSLDGEKTRIFCKYAMPEESAKKEAWGIITNSKSDLSKSMR